MKKKSKSMAEELEEAGDALRKFFEVFVESLRIVELLDWITVRLQRSRVRRIVRRCLEEGRKVVIPKPRDPLQFKLVPLLPSKCSHDSEPNLENRCPDCEMLFVRIVYADWLALRRPTYLYRSVHEGFSGILDKDTRIRVYGGEVIELVPKETKAEQLEPEVAAAVAKMPENDARLLCSLALIRLVDLGYGEKDILAWLAADLEETIATKKEHDDAL